MLPRDLSMLSKVKYLDISNNLVKSVADIVDGLASLPSLTHLSITLSSESEKAELAASLRALEFLNGEEILHEESEEFEVDAEEPIPDLIES